jgi:hypothetical protein
MGPVDEGTVRVNAEIQEHAPRLVPQDGDCVNGDVQHPLLRASDQQHIAAQVSIHDLASAVFRDASGVDSAQQLGHLWGFEAFDSDDVKTVFSPDLGPSHPLSNLVGMRGWLREQQVEGFRNHGSHPRVRQNQRIVIGVREHDHVQFVGALAGSGVRDGVPQVTERRALGQTLVPPGGAPVSLGEARRRRNEFH